MAYSSQVAQGNDTVTHDHVGLFKGTIGSGWQAVHRIPLTAFVQVRTPERARDLLGEQILRFLERTGAKTSWLVSIPPLGLRGFSIDLSKHDNKFCVLFGELEENFETLDDALTWISRALSDRYQLRVTIIGGRRREWSLEPVAPNTRDPILAAGEFVPFRSIRSTSSVIYNNSLTPP